MLFDGFFFLSFARLDIYWFSNYFYNISSKCFKLIVHTCRPALISKNFKGKSIFYGNIDLFISFFIHIYGIRKTILIQYSMFWLYLDQYWQRNFVYSNFKNSSHFHQEMVLCYIKLYCFKLSCKIAWKISDLLFYLAIDAREKGLYFENLKSIWGFLQFETTQPICQLKLKLLKLFQAQFMSCLIYYL